MKVLRILFVFAFLAPFIVNAQDKENVVVDYNQPKEYVIGGVKVEGITYLREAQIVSLTGLAKEL